MAANIEQSSLGFNNLFKRAKKFYCQSKNNGERLCPNKNCVLEGGQKTKSQRQDASMELSSTTHGKSLEESNRKISNKPNIQTPVLNEERESMRKSKSKDVNDILTPEARDSIVNSKSKDVNDILTPEARDSMRKSKSKDVKDVLIPEARIPEIRSETTGLEGVENSQNLSELCRPETCKNYALSQTLNSDRLTEIINNSIKAVVQNLANDTNPPCWRRKQDQENITPIESAYFNDTSTHRSKSSQNKENVTSVTEYSQQAVSRKQENPTPIESACFNDTCTKRSKLSQNKQNVNSVTEYYQEGVPRKQENVTPIEPACFNDTCTKRSKANQNKENVTSCTQYSQRAISSIRPKVSGNICSIYANNSSTLRNSRRSYNSHRRSSPRQSPICSLPLPKSGASSVICPQSIRKYKQITCPGVKQKSDKPSKSCEPCKPCRHLKADNRKMTGNVNIYICSEGNDGGGKKKKKESESTCNSMTVTNVSCACSSADICACRSTTSSKTIRNLMEKRNKMEDITLKCVCGKQPSDCECFPVQSINAETEALCLCDTSSLNPTASNETCRNIVDCNPATPSNSDSLPQGDYCSRRVRSRSSSWREPYCIRQNCDTLNQVAGLENSSEIYIENSKFMTGNSGRGDTIQECSCCDTLSNSSDSKFNICTWCDVNDVDNPSLRNQRKRYVPEDNIDYSRRENVACKCCACEDTSLYSRGRKNDVDRSVCCQNKNVSKPQVQLRKKEYCIKPCDTPRGSVCGGNNPYRSRYSNFCIMEEEEETCDVSSCEPPRTKQQQNLCRINTFQEDSIKFCRRDSNVREDEVNNNERSGATIVNKEQNDVVLITDDDPPASQTIEDSKKMPVAEVKSHPNADKSTSSNMIPPITPDSPRLSPPVSKTKSVVQSKIIPEKQSRGSSLKWQFNKAKDFISGKNTPRESNADKSPAGTPKPKASASSKKPVKNGSMPNSVNKNSGRVAEKARNSHNPTSATKSIIGEESSSIPKTTAGEKSPFVLKSTAGEKSSSIIQQASDEKSSSVLKPTTDEKSSSVLKPTAGGNSSSVSKPTAGENSSSLVRNSTVGNSLLVIKSSVDGEDKSKQSIGDNNKTKLSSSRLGSLIAERKSSAQSAANETARSNEDNQYSGPCYCGAADADMCTCQHPQCSCCNRPQEDCKYNKMQDRPKEQPCKRCQQSRQLCCCYDVNNQQKKYLTSQGDGGFRVCTLCCRPEKDCCCNSIGQTPRRSRSPSNSYNKTKDSYGLISRKSQICLYCEEPRDKCVCRAPITKCSYCGMPIDVCNCQDVTVTCNASSYDENICQCNGRVIQNSDNGEENICVTAWTPRRDIRKYFSRNLGERDIPDCTCCETVRPYGSDELPYQRLSVFSDVMNELQQKMSEPACCNRCGKTPCCCYLHESKSHTSPANEGRMCNTKQRKSRSRSPSCRHCLGTSPCECSGYKTPSYQICNRCRTAPCRCRKSRSTQKKPHAKCYYCKCSPCRCESSRATATAPKNCRCNGSPPRSQNLATPSTTDRIPDKHLPTPRPRSCRCRCASPSCGSPPRVQERPCG